MGEKQGEMVEIKVRGGGWGKGAGRGSNSFTENLAKQEQLSGVSSRWD